MQTLSRITALSLGLTLGPTLGCYGYYPPSTGDLTGRTVQLVITDAGAIELAPRLGTSVQSVSGAVISQTAAGFTISVTETQRRDGVESMWRGETIEIPRPLISSTMERHFSRARTILFLGATSLAMVGIKHSFGGGAGSNAPGNTNPPPVIK